MLMLIHIFLGANLFHWPLRSVYFVNIHNSVDDIDFTLWACHQIKLCFYCHLLPLHLPLQFRKVFVSLHNFITLWGCKQYSSRAKGAFSTHFIIQSHTVFNLYRIFFLCYNILMYEISEDTVVVRFSYFCYIKVWSHISEVHALPVTMKMNKLHYSCYTDNRKLEILKWIENYNIDHLTQISVIVTS